MISGIGALNGWTMVTAEMPYAAAKDGLFLQQFTKETSKGVPWFGIVVSTAVASALMGWSYSSQTGLDVFTDLVYLSVVTVAIPYFLAASAQLAFLVSRRRVVNGWGFVRDLTIAVVGLLFSLWVTFASGYASVYQAMLLLLLGIPVYGFLKARRERLGQVDEPVDMPPELADERL
jgi:APA family basic amino acid/polyamine antiporter